MCERDSKYPCMDGVPFLSSSFCISLPPYLPWVQKQFKWALLHGSCHFEWLPRGEGEIILKVNGTCPSFCSLSGTCIPAVFVTHGNPLTLLFLKSYKWDVGEKGYVVLAFTLFFFEILPETKDYIANTPSSRKSDRSDLPLEHSDLFSTASKILYILISYAYVIGIVGAY